MCVSILVKSTRSATKKNMAAALTVFHEHAKGNILREHLGAAGAFGIVHDAGVQLGHQEPRLALVLIAHHVPRHGEPVVHDHLHVCLRRLEEIPKRHVLLLLVVALLPPRHGRLAMEEDDMEEGVQEEDGIGPDGLGVQQHRLGWSVKGVGEQGGLDHDKGVRRVLLVQYVAIVGRLVRNGVEELEELGPAQVEEELGEEAEFGRETEGVGIDRNCDVLPIEYDV